MVSQRYVAQTGTLEEFLAANPLGAEPTGLLFDALTNRNAVGRGDIANYLLDHGADATAVTVGQSTLIVLLSHNHFGPADGALCAKLIDAGADPNFRSPRGELPLQLVVKMRTDSDDNRREAYQALFGSADLDLPADPADPETSIGQWLRQKVDRRPSELPVLAEFLSAHGY